MTQPNIVMILIDDLGWRDLGCYGSTFYETPNLDQLAGDGMRFTQAYAACPVCSPTRASLLTGRYPARVGITDWIDWGGWIHPARGRLLDAPYLRELPRSEVTLATRLRALGYRTWHVGKWHLGGPDSSPLQHGFEVNIGGCDWGAPRHGYFSPYQMPGLPDGPAGEYLSDRLTDEAIRLIQSHDGTPFSLNLCHYAVHTPIQVKPQDLRHFQGKAADLKLDHRPALVEGEHFPTLHKRTLRVTRRVIQSDPAYAAMVWNLDWNIGRLLDALVAAGQADHTVVVFTSDNGGLATSEGSPTCNAPLAEGKGWMYDGGIREPLLVRWPGVIRPGSICHAPVSSPDFLPTFVDLASGAPPDDPSLDGVSFVPLLRGQTALDRDAIYWHYPHYGNQGGSPACAVRQGDFKLIEFFEDNRLELYNLAGDLGETRNLAADMPDHARRLHDLLRRWRDGIGARIPECNPLYDQQFPR